MSLRARLLGLALRGVARPVTAAWAIVPGAPWPYGLLDRAGLLACPVPGTRFDRQDLPHTRAQWVTPADHEPDRVILYFHGGAFLFGGWHLHRNLLSRIARATRSRILAIEYRKLPVHPVSASVEDSLEAYRFLLSQGVPAEHVVMMGDSAGGFLTFATAAEARRDGLPAPAGLVAMSPLCELTDAAVTAEEALMGCALFGPRSVPAMRRLMVAAEEGVVVDAEDFVAPGMPPVLVQAARRESLFPQIERLAGKLEACGASYELQVWDHDIHVFQAATWLPETVEAMAGIVAFVEEAYAGLDERASS